MKPIFILLAFTIFASNCLSQITIDSDDVSAILANGNSTILHYEYAEQVLDIGEPGGGNIFDFSILSFSETVPFTSFEVANTPYSENYPNANICMSSVFSNENETFTNYIYYDNDEGFDLLGQVTEFENFDDLFITNWNPPQRTFSYPMTYGTEWTSISNRTEIEGGDVGAPESIEEEYIVDAYGTMILPDGTSEEALRIRLRTTIEEQFTYVDYLFWCLSGASVEIECAQENPPNSGEVQVISAAYNGPMTILSTNNSFPEGYGLIANYPNPFLSKTVLEYNLPIKSAVKITIRDITGKQIEDIHVSENSPGLQKLEINTNEWLQGIYIATLQTDRFSDTVKMSKLTQ